MGKWLGPPHAEIRRCGAKARSGHPCGRYSMANGRCLLHGGKSTGAKSPWVKHGMYTKAAIEERKWLNELIKEANRFASEIIV
jgi:hypothetical protein